MVIFHYSLSLWKSLLIIFVMENHVNLINLLNLLSKALILKTNKSNILKKCKSLLLQNKQSSYSLENLKIKQMETSKLMCFSLFKKELTLRKNIFLSKMGILFSSLKKYLKSSF